VDVAEIILEKIRGEYPQLEDFRNKNSHENKSLLQHVRECESLSGRLIDLIYPDERYLRNFVNALAIVHDLGKLLPEWELGVKPKFRHAVKGFEILREIWERKHLPGMLSLNEELTEALLYFVNKHHSSLIFDEYFRRFDNILQCSNSVQRIKLADAFGIFKLADIVSASNMNPEQVETQYRQRGFSPEIIERNVSDVVKKKVGRFDSSKYNLQKEIASLKERHVFVAAPTGWGKTALSLLRSSIGPVQPMKVFYILPTITAIKEFSKKLEQVFGEGEVGQYFHFSDVELLKMLGRDEDEGEYAHLLNLYRYFIPRVVVTTIDQVLLTALQVGKYHLRRFNFMNALFVFDEFHLFTPQMIGALKVVLELLREYRLSTFFMSATPGEAYINELRESLEDAGGHSYVSLEEEYRKLQRHKISLEDSDILDFTRSNFDTLTKSLQEGERILFVTNTVDRAVEVYDCLKESLKREDILLLHSRFTYEDRSRKEEEVERAKVLVATQVAEVSLDISFEKLVTEVAPLPSLIQRFGRVNRYGEKALKENVWICQKLERCYPYASIEISETKRRLSILKEEGEAIYLSILRDYEFSPSGVIESIYNKISEMLKDNNLAFYTCIDLNRVQEMIGREPSVPAIPANYRNTARNLLRQAKQSSSYSERRKLLAMVKEYIVPIDFSVFAELKNYRECAWDEELRNFLVCTEGDRCHYSAEKGLTITK